MSERNLPMVIWRTEDQIRVRVAELAAEIQRDLTGEPVTLMGLLPETFVFMADLIRHLKMAVRCNFISLYYQAGSTREDGLREIDETLIYPVSNYAEQNILLLTMVLDTGVIMDHIQNHIRLMGVKSIRIATCLDKPFKRRVNLRADYVAFETAETDFIIGYGLDCEGYYRNLPYLARIKPGSNQPA